jgi:hypothetical protein
MSVSPPVPNESGLKVLEGRSFADILLWLEGALRGRESLPVAIPGESPEGPILRWERSLAPLTRTDLREACRTLIRRFIRTPQDESDYVVALLGLAQGFGAELKDAVTDLHRLTVEGEAFQHLPPKQVSAVISTLLDLKAPLPLDYWKDLLSRLPAAQKAFAFTGLLRHGVGVAFDLLPSLPDDQDVADSLYVILDQHAEQLNATERDKMAALAREKSVACPAQIRLMLNDWLAEQPEQGHASRIAVASVRGLRLDSVFKARADDRGLVYQPQPASARLIAA